jgi:hypothetical protein
MRAIAAGLACGATACSFVAAPTVPPRETWSTTSAPRCERSSAALGADIFGFLATAPLAVAGVVIAVDGDSYGGGGGDGRGRGASDPDLGTIVAGLLLPAVAFAASAGYGLHADHVCTEYDAYLDAWRPAGR